MSLGDVGILSSLSDVGLLGASGDAGVLGAIYIGDVGAFRDVGVFR